MTNEPTELDQHELQTRIDMRAAAEDTLRRYGEGSSVTTWAHMAAAILAKYILTLLDEIEQSEAVVGELTEQVLIEKQVEKVIGQRDRMAAFLREMMVRYNDPNDPLGVRFQKQLIDAIQKAIK